MQIRISPGAYGDETYSHHLELTDIADELLRQGYRLTRIEKGRRGSRIPIINLDLQAAPADGTVINLPIQLHVEPYDSQRALNVRVTLVGLRERLHLSYGARQGEEFGVRLFIANFDGEYLAPEQGDERGAPGDPDDRPRDRVMRAIAARRGAPAFRNNQLERFDRRCAVSGCTLVDVLEAAHIRAYRREGDNASENGLLLRADLHTLFDLDLLAVNPDNLLVSIHDSVTEVQYRQFHEQPVIVPAGGFDMSALQQRWTMFRSRGE